MKKLPVGANLVKTDAFQEAAKVIATALNGSLMGLVWGAPGVGKTFVAQQMADLMDADFVTVKERSSSRAVRQEVIRTITGVLVDMAPE